jgi:organic radical activating enzyme
MKKYRINEIFYSLQGEGKYTGHAAVFVRFSGCNLRCPFCDTDFKQFTEMTAAEIVSRVNEWKNCGFVVLTGGEPTLQVDKELVGMLKGEGFYVAMETNGTGHVPENVDWVTLSPKSCFVSHAPALVTMKVNEVKVVFDGIHDPMPYGQLGEGLYLNLQPCDTGDEHKNREVTRQCVEYIKQHPQWHLSLQTHKLISIP